MKKQNSESIIKAARKTARKNIKRSLITEMTAIAGKLAPVSKGIKKVIHKDAKGLAKKIAKALVITDVAPTEAVKEITPAEPAKPVVAKAIRGKKKVIADTAEA